MSQATGANKSPVTYSSDRVVPSTENCPTMPFARATKLLRTSSMAPMCMASVSPSDVPRVIASIKEVYCKVSLGLAREPSAVDSGMSSRAR